MDGIIREFAQRVAEDGRKRIRAAMRDVAKEIEKDFKLKAQRCLDNYYMEYTPIVYTRTDNLRNNAVQTYKRYRRGEMDIGVSITPEQMSPYARKNSKDYSGNFPLISVEDFVVSNAMQGIHGNENIFVGNNIDEEMKSFTFQYVSWGALDNHFQTAFAKYN